MYWASSGDPYGYGAMDFSIDRSRIPAGTELTADIALYLDNGESVPVTISATGPTGGLVDVETAPLYVVLVETQNGEPVDQTYYETGLTLDEFGSEFVIPDVAPGTYLIVYGTNMDADLYLCDTGEICGLYPSYYLADFDAGTFAEFTVTEGEDLTLDIGVDYATQYNVAAQPVTNGVTSAAAATVVTGSSGASADELEGLARLTMAVR